MYKVAVVSPCRRAPQCSTWNTGFFNRLRADFLNPAGLNARRIPKGSNVTPLSVVCPPPLLFLHAANGETDRTAVAALGVHVGTAEVQERPALARRRRRRTAPGATVFTHIDQTAGPAGAATRSGVKVGSARFVGASNVEGPTVSKGAGDVEVSGRGSVPGILSENPPQLLRCYLITLRTRIENRFISALRIRVTRCITPQRIILRRHPVISSRRRIINERRRILYTIKQYCPISGSGPGVYPGEGSGRRSRRGPEPPPGTPLLCGVSSTWNDAE